MGTEKAIETIYAEREKFIIIVLTSRTGSGCTTVSDILKAERFEDLHLHEPKTKVTPFITATAITGSQNLGRIWTGSGSLLLMAGLSAGTPFLESKS